MTNQAPIQEKKLLAKAEFMNISGMGSGDWPYNPDDVDKMEVLDVKEYRDTVDLCRFFYKKDPIAGTVVNKMMDIAITKLKFEKGSLSDNEFRIYTGLTPKLQKFAEEMAMEYLLSGLIVPEVTYSTLPVSEVKSFGIKKYEAVTGPTAMWCRDSKTIKIMPQLLLSEPTYWIEIPDDLYNFVKSDGKYADGISDVTSLLELKTYYPEFVTAIQSGQRYIKLDNPLITRRRPLPDSPYPIPYLYPSLEALKHKRNLRRMDYSIAARVITAIQQIKMGDKDFPLTEDDQEQVGYLQNQMKWRDGTGQNMEKVFQLFTNHTIEIKWIFPDTAALLNDVKYINVNNDIFLSLGFPRILTTGETERTGTSNPEFATLSPVRTMEKMQDVIIKIIEAVAIETAKRNNWKGIPKVSFENMNLHAFADFVAGMTMLYNTGNISRTSLAEAFGYNWEEEINMRSDEDEQMKELQVGEFAPQPYSPQPGGSTQPGADNAQNEQKKAAQKKDTQTTKQTEQTPKEKKTTEKTTTTRETTEKNA
jgi:hypothetical protein